MENKLLQQSNKLPVWLGGVQVQVSNSGYYTVWYSQVMMAVTFWTIAGYPFAQLHMPWLSFWVFALILVGSLAVLLVIDFIFIQPARMAFINEQACKHENPAMIEILELRKEVSAIKQILEDRKCK